MNDVDVCNNDDEADCEGEDAWWKSTGLSFSVLLDGWTVHVYMEQRIITEELAKLCCCNGLSIQK